MSPTPNPDVDAATIRTLAESLTDEEIVILPFYHDLRSSFVKPDRVKIQTEYFWQRWVPLLGPVRSLIVMRMRQYGYYNRRTKEIRDECTRTYEEIAASIGISSRTLERYFESDPDPEGGPYRILKDPLMAQFVKLRHQYVWKPGKSAPERTTNEYKIAMDEPLTPEDEVAFRLAAAQRLAQDERAVGVEARSSRHTRQNGAYDARNGLSEHTRHSVAYEMASSDRHPVGTDSVDTLAPQPVALSNTPDRTTTTTAFMRSLGQAESAGSVDGDSAKAMARLIVTFEAANGRSASSLEVQILSSLSAEVEPLAAARGSSGVQWVAGAIVEAVESGSRYVAPKRLREICRRWGRDGRPAPVSMVDMVDAANRQVVGDEAGGSDLGGRLSVGPRPSARDRARPSRGRSKSPASSGPATPADRLSTEIATKGDSAANTDFGAERTDHPDESPEVERAEPEDFVVDPSVGLTSKQLWAGVIEELRSRTAPGAFATWLLPTRLIGIENGTLIIGTPSSYSRDRLVEQLGPVVTRVVAEIVGSARPVRFVVQQEWLSHSGSS